jgi:hypothetical protein
MAKARDLIPCLIGSYRSDLDKKTRRNCSQCVGIKYFTSVIFAMLFSKYGGFSRVRSQYIIPTLYTYVIHYTMQYIDAFLLIQLYIYYRLITISPEVVGVVFLWFAPPQCNAHFTLRGSKPQEYHTYNMKTHPRTAIRNQ